MIAHTNIKKTKKNIYYFVIDLFLRRFCECDQVNIMQHLVTEKPNACNTINKNINLIFLLLAVVQHNLSRTKIKSSYIEKRRKKLKMKI